MSYEISRETCAILANPPIASQTLAAPNENFSKLGVGVIGCGYWGPHHVRCFRGWGNCQVTAVDTDSEKLQRLVATYSDLRTEANFERVLSNSAIHAVVIATPTSTHFALAKQALLAGKHVLCEKPLCSSAAQASELVNLANRLDLTLMTGHTFLFNPNIVQLKRAIDDGELGELLSLAAVRTNLGPIRNDANVVLDLAVHDVSIFNWFLESEPIRVTAVGGDFVQSGIQDVAYVNLVYPQGQVANVHVSWLSPKKVRQITLVGRRRMATWDDMELSTPLAIYDRGAKVSRDDGTGREIARVTTWDGEVRLPRVDAAEPLKVQSRYFLDAIANPALRRSNGDFSRGVVRTLEAICQSLAACGAPVSLEHDGHCRYSLER